uniref:ATP synthase subunit delta, chloroplastic n=1 Tax=Caloglossa beccarii TaxID=131038 RepID=A0A1Z1M959_9FLOR|nr:ATP synthase CF1 subunit delta [Caloglossa beccarii]ARW62274.1 ATP synthase CF1 subunit delta [Caloglossa beccarii]
MNNANLVEKISIPYAEALLEIAKDSNLLEETKKDLSVIYEALSDSKDLQLFLANPLLEINAKKSMIDRLFKNKVNQIILNFLFVLIDKRRISILQSVIDKYFELVYKLESVTVVELTTSIEFNQSQTSNLIEKIKIIGNTKNIKLITNIDLNLMAGFILKIGSKVIDTSLLGKLKQISLYLNTN